MLPRRKGTAYLSVLKRPRCVQLSVPSEPLQLEKPQLLLQDNFGPNSNGIASFDNRYILPRRDEAIDCSRIRMVLKELFC